MVFSGKYSRSPIASTNLVLKYTVFPGTRWVAYLSSYMSSVLLCPSRLHPLVNVISIPSHPPGPLTSLPFAPQIPFRNFLVKLFHKPV
uniref:Uncharacterized protein n=1 Tax=Calidris pygmaea TaxID=425635 RepID=A0A8C3J214_9CHAR